MMPRKDIFKDVLQNTINYSTYFLGLFLGIIYRRIGKRKSVIIVRTDNIGDYILFMPFLELIRKKYPDYQINIILKNTVSQLVEGYASIDEVVIFNEKKYRRNIWYKYAFLLKLLREKYAICLYPAYSRERIGDEMVLWTAAAQRIAWDSDATNMTWAEKVRGDRIYTTLIKGYFSQTTHESERNREFLQNLEIRFDELHREVWRLGEESRKIQGLLKKIQAAGKQIAVIVPGAYANYRQWGAAKINELMSRLSEAYDQIYFVIVGTGQENKGLEIPATKNCKSNYLDLCGKTDLKELQAVLASSKVVVGNETGTLHLAIALGVPTVCILGGGQFGRFMPYGDPLKHKYVYKKMNCFNCNWHCIYDYAKCIADIPVDDVLVAVNSIWQNIS